MTDTVSSELDRSRWMRYGTLVVAATDPFATSPVDVVVEYTDVGVTGAAPPAFAQPVGSGTIGGPFASICTDAQPNSENVVSAETVPPSENSMTVLARRMKPSPSIDSYTNVLS